MESKRIQKLGIAAAVFAVLVVVAAVIIPKLIDLNRYRGLIVTELEKAVEGKVEIGSLAWGISNGISLSVEGFSIQNADVVPVDFKIDRIATRIAILPLLKKAVIIKSLRLERPVVYVKLPFERPQEKTSTGNQASSESTDTGLPVTIVISKIDLVDGQVTIEDALSSAGRAQAHVLDNVRLQGTNLVPGEKMQFSLAFKEVATPGLGEFEASGTFEGLTRELRLENPRLSVMLSLDSFGLDTLKPYLKNNATASKMGGVVSLDLNYQGDLGRRFTADGSIDLSRFSYSDPQLWEQALPGGPARIDYKIRLDPERIGVDKLDLRLGNLLIGLRAGLDKWNSTPVLKDVLLSADLPLAETIPFVPWKLLKDDNAGILHATLERGGRINVDKIEIPPLALNQFPDNWEPFVSDIEAVTKLSGISVPPRADFPGLENLSADLTLTKGVLDASILKAMFGPVTLPKLDARVADLFTQPKVTVKAKGSILFPETEEGAHKPFYDAHGLTRITGKAAVDLKAAFDQSDPGSWQVDGFVNLDNIDADFESRGVQLKDLRGKIRIRRQKDFSIKMEGLSGLINRSSFHLDATAAGSNASNLRIDANTRVQQLDLSQLAALVPALGKMMLSGVVDADMEIHLPLDNPRGSRLGGFLKLQDFSFKLAEPAISVTDGNAELHFPTDSVEVTQLTLRYNEQPLSVTGTASNIEHPQVNLTLKSPNLDIDRLIPPDGPSQSAAPAEGEKTEPAAKKKELPELARRSTVQLSVALDKGTYRRSEFKNLKLSAHYDQGVFKEHQVAFDIAEGRIQNSGSIDLRDLDRIHFDLKPAIESVRIEKVVALFQAEKSPIEGPVSVSGQLSGRSGPDKELVRSLNGSISAELGNGRIYKVGPIGQLVADILSFTSLRGILSGDIFKDMAHNGVAYRDVEIKTEIDSGIVGIHLFKLQGDSFNANSVGAVNLVEDSLNLKIEMDTLGFIDKAIGFVPILGKGTQKLLHVYLDVNGPIDDPQIKISPVKGLTGFVGGTVDSTDDLVKGTEEKIKK